MCATDLATELDLELDIAGDGQATGPQPIGSHYAGVAWGLAKRPGDPAERPGAPAAGDPVTGDPAVG